MKKLILDYSKWRCGGDDIISPNIIGKGSTEMCNNSGFMCCLGQFSLQLNTDLKEADIITMGEPYEIKKLIPTLNEPMEDDFNDEDGPYFSNSDLSDMAIEINDDPTTSPEIKIKSLKNLFIKYDYEIEVINKP